MTSDEAYAVHLKAEYEKLVAEKLLCDCYDQELVNGPHHTDFCPARFRPAIVALLLAERQKVLVEVLNKKRDLYEIGRRESEAIQFVVNALEGTE